MSWRTRRRDRDGPPELLRRRAYAVGLALLAAVLIGGALSRPLCNKGSFAACRVGCLTRIAWPEGCVRAGVMAVDSEYRIDTVADALTWFDEACDRGLGPGCNAREGALVAIYRSLHYQPEGAEKTKALDRLCGFGHERACREAIDTRMGVDWARAVDLHARWCRIAPDADRPRHCSDDFAAFVSDIRRRASACEDGDARACSAAATPLVRREYPRFAMRLFAEECRLRGIEALHAPNTECGTGQQWFYRFMPEGRAGVCAYSLAERALTPVERPPPVRTSPTGAGRVTPIVDSLELKDYPEGSVLELVDRVSPELAGCYEAALRRDPEIEGRVSVRVVVDKLGDVASVALGGYDVSDLELARCVRETFTAKSAPRPKSGVGIFVLPLAFERADGVTGR